MKMHPVLFVVLMISACLTTAVVTRVYDPTLSALAKHGIGVREMPSPKGSALMFAVMASKTFVSMDFNGPVDKPSTYDFFDSNRTCVGVDDRNQDGTFESTRFNIRRRDGISYAYTDMHLDGDFSVLFKEKDGTKLDEMLKVDGKWLSAKFAGKKGIVMLDGKSTLVDPSKSPIAVIGPASPAP